MQLWKKAPRDTRSPQRRLLEETIIPELHASGEVLFVGVQDYCRYTNLFSNARRYDTFDIDPSVQPTMVGDICHATNIADETYDWVIFNGMYERVDNPFQAVSELHRVLRSGGLLLFGAPFKMHAWPGDTTDRWRITKRGIHTLLHRFHVLKTWDVGEDYFYFLCRKVEGTAS